jgi:hypothetical protein
MGVGQAQGADAVEVGAVGRHRVGVQGRLSRHPRGRGDPHAHAPGTPDVGDRLDHGQREAQPVLQRAPVGVLAEVRRVSEELFEEVVVGGVDLHAVEAGLLRVGGGPAVVLDDRRDLLGLQRSRGLHVLHAILGEGLSRGLHRGGCHRQRAVVEVGVGEPAGVPQLQQEEPIAGMDRIHDGPPGLDLLRRPDAGGEGVAHGLW